jgi:serine/threonine-protein kinase
VEILPAVTSGQPLLPAVTSGQPAEPADGLNHTLIVADAGFTPDDEDQPLTGRVHGPAGSIRRREPGLQRWLFSRRLAYLSLGIAVVLVLVLMTWWVTNGQFETIPQVGTMTKATARTELRNLGFTVKTGPGVHSNTLPRGEVIRTVPAIGTRAHRGSLVTLIPSLGPVMLRVPSVTGLKLADAEAALRRVGLRPGKVRTATSSTIPLGVVISTNPVAGLSWPQTRPVTIVQSDGIPLPNLIGQQLSAAQQVGQQDGFQPNPQPDANSDQPAGTITAQSPEPGTPITPGEVVTIKVSTGPQLVDVPNVDGQQEQQAIATLTAAGFQVNVDHVGPGHRVFNFSPTGQAPKGSTITIFVGFGGFGGFGDLP